MNWKFWRSRKGTDIAFVRSDVPLTTLFHWYCYDLGIDNPNEVAKLVGLAPVSKEVAEREREESDKRVDRLIPMLSFLQIMAELNGLVSASMQTSFLKEDLSLPEEQIERLSKHLQDTFAVVSLSALISAFSAALEVGLVAPDHAIAHGVVERTFDE